MVNQELEIESNVSKKLNAVIEGHITNVQKHKRIVAKCHQDNEAAKIKYQVRYPKTRCSISAHRGEVIGL
jgi:hypothetical protein